MLSIANINPLVRAIGVISAVAILVAGITMAAFTTNSVALNNNDITVDGDVLRIWNGSGFTTSALGFSNNVVLGTEGPKQAFYLQNLSNADLTLSVSLASTPVVQNIDTTKVTLNFYDEVDSPLLSTTLAALDAADQPLAGQLDALATGSTSGPTEGNYSYSVTVAADGALGNPASIVDIDLAFTGTAPE